MSKFLDFTGLSHLVDKLKTIFLSINASAKSADKLSTARSINGGSFDGSSDITVSDNTKLPLSGGTMGGGLT